MSDNADTPSMKNLYITETVNVRYDNIARVSLKCRKTILLQKFVIIILLLKYIYNDLFPTWNMQFILD